MIHQNTCLSLGTAGLLAFAALFSGLGPIEYTRPVIEAKITESPNHIISRPIHVTEPMMKMEV